MKLLKLFGCRTFLLAFENEYVIYNSTKNLDVERR